MKTITIPVHPECWGAETTDAQSVRWATQMATCAEQAGFRFDCNTAEGTTEEAMLYSWDYRPDAEEDEIDWFKRWCQHGFRAMTNWLNKAKGQ